MVSYAERFARIANDFKANGISTENPGFYDDPNFTRIERQYPVYLNNYARFVQRKSYSKEYIKRAEKIINITAMELLSELVTDGRQGACIDTSLVFSRILEREGVWNYIVKGALTIILPSESQIDPLYFWHLDTNNSLAGHAWIVAPPFLIIDITLKQQPDLPPVSGEFTRLKILLLTCLPFLENSQG